MGICLVLHWLRIKKILGTCTKFRDPSNIFRLAFLDKVLNYYKYYQCIPILWFMWSMGLYITVLFKADHMSIVMFVIGFG